MCTTFINSYKNCHLECHALSWVILKRIIILPQNIACLCTGTAMLKKFDSSRIHLHKCTVLLSKVILASILLLRKGVTHPSFLSIRNPSPMLPVLQQPSIYRLCLPLYSLIMDTPSSYYTWTTNSTERVCQHIVPNVKILNSSVTSHTWW